MKDSDELLCTQKRELWLGYKVPVLLSSLISTFSIDAGENVNDDTAVAGMFQ